jgi:hypothetical protein
MVEAYEDSELKLFPCRGWLELKLRYQPGSVISFLMTRTSEKESHCLIISMVNWMAGFKLLRWVRKFCNCSGP